MGQAPPPFVASEEDERARRSNASKKSNVYVCSMIKYLSRTVVSCFLRIVRCASQDDSDWVRARTACLLAQRGDQHEQKSYTGSIEEKEKKEEASRRDPTLMRTLFWREPLEEDERARVANSGRPLGEKGTQRNSCRKRDEK